MPSSLRRPGSVLDLSIRRDYRAGRPSGPGFPPTLGAMTQSSQPDAPRPWPKLSSEPGPDLFVARARYDLLVNPRTEASMRRMVLETPDWVNVVALTRERELVLVRQYRFGTAHVTLEIPGGVIDPGEESAQAAIRELREETGYTASSWTYLGAVEPNPAFHDNRCHHWLATDVERTAEQDQDPGEDIRVEVHPVDQVLEWIRTGQVDHSLVICALARVFDLRASSARDSGGNGDLGPAAQ